MKLHKADFNVQVAIMLPMLICCAFAPAGLVIAALLAIPLGIYQVSSGLFGAASLHKYNRKYGILLLSYLGASGLYLAILFSGGLSGDLLITYMVPGALAIYYLVISYHRAFKPSVFSPQQPGSSPNSNSKNIIS